MSGVSGSGAATGTPGGAEVGTAVNSTPVSTALLTSTHPDDAVVLTPMMRTRLRRALLWISLSIFAVLVAVLVFGMFGANSTGRPLSPDNPAPDGSRAIAQVLRGHGVEVHEATSLALASEVGTPAATTTLLLHDDRQLLDRDQLQQAAGLADRIVLLDPGAAALEALAPGVLHAGAVGGVLAADCAVGAVGNAGSVTGEGQGYRLADPTDGAARGCLGSGDGVFSLIELDIDGRTVTVLGTTAALRNDAVAFEGNAALVLTVLGHTETLIWYQPGAADVVASEVPIAELMPKWVTPLPFALLVIVLAAGVWRGRRFGPLVVEQLPVTVRARETMEGRARLYEQSSARAHALDALRIGTIDRVAKRCGLPGTASADEVCLAVAALLGRPVAQVRALLLDDEPRSDRDLVALSDALLDLEARVDQAAAPA